MTVGDPCERCREDPGDRRFCAVCGKDQRPHQPLFPTPEARAAGERGAAWLAAHPEVAEREDDELRAAAELAREPRALRRPDRFDRYRPLATRARLARGWLIVAVALSVIVAGLEVLRLSLLADLPPDAGLDTDGLVSNARSLTVGYVSQLVVFLLCGRSSRPRSTSSPASAR